ncbi:MAG: transketolase [Rikenellaceae bacterium]|nr:transketolase [Rikenellaceae bacterium]
MANLSKKAADNIRILAASMVEKAKSGHPGGAMGGADFINVLYSEFLRYNPSDYSYPFRDRLFLDPGHMSPMLYGVLAAAGIMPMEEIKNFRQWGSHTPGHPEVDLTHAIENTSGPLGQGHVMAVGAAIAERFLAARFGEWTAHKTYAFISDGGIQEEVSQGAGRIAGHLGLANLIMFYDSNNVQLSTKVDEVSAEDVAAKYRAWGWSVLEINGNDADEIRAALNTAIAETERPTLIIGNTVMGFGARDKEGASFEGRVNTHGQPLSAAGADMPTTIANLGGNPEEPFTLFAETVELYAKRREELNKWFAERQQIETEWRNNNSEAAAKLNRFLSGRLPELDFSQVAQGDNAATRAASATVLKYLAANVENMIVSSADLSNSDKTDGFKVKPLAKGDFSGGFLNAGVSELTMACIMNGIALHGGVYCACGTFFVFSDYMKPALRLAALQRLPIKYVWTHDSFRVGEDGPTHQPIEHEAQLRLMEQLRNHRGERSTLVLRPADGNETTVAWQMAMENERPTALVLSRQNIKQLPGSSWEKAQGVRMGAYVVEDCEGTPDVILLASGSEVSTLAGAAELLRAEGVKIRLVSVPSEGLFRDQSREYQLSVLPEGVRRYGLTSGLPCTLAALVGENGMIQGLDHFGYSAPAGVLDEKFGYTPAQVYENVMKFLK